MSPIEFRVNNRTASPVIDLGVSPRTPPDGLTCFQRIAIGFLQSIECGRKSADPEGVHRMRIHLTRLRAAALFFKPVTGSSEWQAIERRLRWLNSALGKARDRDVAVAYASRKHYRRYTAKSRSSLLRLQDRAHRRLSGKLASTRCNSLVSALRQFISNDHMPRLKHIEKVDQLEDYCEQRLGEWKTELCDQGKYVRMLRRKPLHRLRIRSKYYRYMVEALLDSDIPVPREEFSFCETARRIHRTLGELRDLKLLHKATGRKPPRYRKRERALIRQVADMFFPFVGKPARVK